MQKICLERLYMNHRAVGVTKSSPTHWRYLPEDPEVVTL